MRPVIEDRSDSVGEDQPIWHYRQFVEFVSILQNDALWFSRLDQLRDCFEGRSASAEASAHFAKADAHTRSGCISCWTIDDVESDLMWCAYASNFGVGIRSTKGKLKAALAEADVGRVVIDSVRYAEVPTRASELSENERSQSYPEAFRKARHFRREQELRAFIPRGELKVSDTDYKGRLVTLALPDLLTEVWVSPAAPDWFKAVVKAELKEYGYSAVPIRRRSSAS